MFRGTYTALCFNTACVLLAHACGCSLDRMPTQSRRVTRTTDMQSAMQPGAGGASGDATDSAEPDPIAIGDPRRAPLGGDVTPACKNCDVSCGNGRVDEGEACDGDKLCSVRCERVFDGSLEHRYTFRGSGSRALDIVNGADGEIVGGALDTEGGVRLDGGAAATHVQLPGGLLSALGSATIELFITWRGERVWERIFDFGNSAIGDEGAAQGTSFWSLTARSEDETLQTRLNFTPAPWDSANDARVDAPLLVAGRLQHVATTFDGASGRLRVYVNGRLVDELEGVQGTLRMIDDAHMWIGRSQYENDPPLQATVHELRIYRAALSESAVRQSFELGPDPDLAE